MTKQMSVDDAIAGINNAIDAIGNGGAKAVAGQLGIHPSRLSRIRNGKASMTVDLLDKISSLQVFNGDVDDAAGDDEIYAVGEMTEELNEQYSPPADAPVLPQSIDAIEQAVLGANIETVYSTPKGDLDDDDATGGPSVAQVQPEIAPDEFMKEFWLPTHEMAGAILGEPRGPRLTALAASNQGAAACGAVQRAADRLGITGTLTGGHWIADLAIIGAYAFSVRSVLRG